MGGTLSYSRSELVTREALQLIAPPPATETWKPVAHFDLVHAIDRQLLVRGITIQREAFALQREGMRLFGVLDLAYETTADYCAALGLRTANDRTMALEICVGITVTVCDNMMFSGDVIALRRKHTAKFDLNADISRAVDRYLEHLRSLKGQVERFRETPISDTEAKGMIFEAFHRGILPIRLFPAVADTYFEPKPEWTDVVRGTHWGLANAFTRAIKQLAPAPAFEATTRLGKFLELRG